VEIWNKFARASRVLDISLPKTHLMFHVNYRSVLQGNPWYHTTFLDESLNKTLKKVLRLCHQTAFEQMAFAKLAEVLRRSAKRCRVERV
jgi:hypothetical protein